MQEIFEIEDFLKADNVEKDIKNILKNRFSNNDNGLSYLVLKNFKIIKKEQITKKKKVIYCYYLSDGHTEFLFAPGISAKSCRRFYNRLKDADFLSAFLAKNSPLDYFNKHQENISELGKNLIKAAELIEIKDDRPDKQQVKTIIHLKSVYNDIIKLDTPFIPVNKLFPQYCISGINETKCIFIRENEIKSKTFQCLLEFKSKIPADICSINLNSIPIKQRKVFDTLKKAYNNFRDKSSVQDSEIKITKFNHDNIYFTNSGFDFIYEIQTGIVSISGKYLSDAKNLLKSFHYGENILSNFKLQYNKKSEYFKKNNQVQCLIAANMASISANGVSITYSFKINNKIVKKIEGEYVLNGAYKRTNAKKLNIFTSIYDERLQVAKKEEERQKKEAQGFLNKLAKDRQLYGNPLAIDILNTVILNSSFITESTIVAHLRGTAIKSAAKFTPTNKGSLYNMIPADDICDTITEMCSSNIIQAKIVKGEWGNYAIYKPGKDYICSSFLEAPPLNFKSGKTNCSAYTYADWSAFLDSFPEIKEKKEKQWDNFLTLLDMPEIYCNKKEQYLKCLENAPDDVSEYISIMANCGNKLCKVILKEKKNKKVKKKI